MSEVSGGIRLKFAVVGSDLSVLAVLAIMVAMVLMTARVVVLTRISLILQNSKMAWMVMGAVMDMVVVV